MTEIIIKKDERIDWQKKINSFTSPAAARQWQVDEYGRCAYNGLEGQEYWCKNYIWTIDARKDPAIIPFVLYPYQVDHVKQLNRFADTFIDKSRQMGVSWTTMMWELWNVLYKKGFSALNISRKESEVQDPGNTHHSLHGRLFFMYQRLPPFLRPKVHNPHLAFKVPSMNSVIKGESSNPKAGRDSQYTFVFIDEAAHIDCLDEMWKGVRSASNSICLCSTPPKQKVNNKFAEIRDLPNSGFTQLSFHWSKHPEYSKEWYANKTRSMTKEEIAQELEISYDGALEDTSYPEYKEEIHYMDHKVWYNKNFKLYCFMDFGLQGEVFLFAQKDPHDRIFFIYYKKYKNMLTVELWKEFLKCLGHLGYKPTTTEEGKIVLPDMIFVGDKSGTKRSRTSKTTVIDEYRTVSKGAINIYYQMDLNNEEKMKNMKACLKNYINGKPQFNVSKEPTCAKFSEAMKIMQLNKSKEDHVDNEYTHVVNAAEYGISYLFPRKKVVCAVAGIDPSQMTAQDKIEKPNSINRIPSVTAVLSGRRADRKGAIFHG